MKLMYINECFNYLDCFYCFGFQSGDKEARELWSKLQLKLPSFFEILDNIQPALLHGDLWGGNVGQDDDGPGKGVSFIKSLLVLLHTW